MNSGEINKRTLILDAEWISPEDSESSGAEDENEEMLDFYGNDGDDEDGDEESEDGEEEDDEEDMEDEGESEIKLPPLPPKRKRLMEPSKDTVPPPKKRVTFDLQKPAGGVGPLSKHAPPKLASKK